MKNLWWVLREGFKDQRHTAWVSLILPIYPSAIMLLSGNWEVLIRLFPIAYLMAGALFGASLLYPRRHELRSSINLRLSLRAIGWLSVWPMMASRFLRREPSNGHQLNGNHA